MGLIHTQAIVLETRRLGEADKLVTLFSPDRGKIRAAARGARSLRSRFGAALEPLTRCAVVLFERKPGVLLRLNQSSILDSFPGIRRGLDEMMAAGGMARLVSALMPENEASEKVYDLLVRGLRETGVAERDLEIIVSYFGIHLLKYAGYLPRTDACVQCRGALRGRSVHFSAAKGGTVCPACVRSDRDSGEAVSRGALATLRLELRLPWEGISRLRPAPAVKRELNGILDAIVLHAAGRPSMVRDIFGKPPIEAGRPVRVRS
jgi:DNA repair protein RecO (recombination protein O)